MEQSLEPLSKAVFSLTRHFRSYSDSYGLIVFVFLSCFTTHSFAQCPPEDIISGEFIVTQNFKLDQSSAFPQSHASVSAQSWKTIRKTQLANLQKRYSLVSSQIKPIFNGYSKAIYVIQRLQTRPIVTISSDGGGLSESVEPNCRIRIPNGDLSANATDDSSGNLIARQNMNVARARQKMPVDAQPVLVAVSDTGIDADHDDLKDSLWNNQAEISGRAGIDDDNNGCIDDIHGCDLADQDSNSSPGPKEYSIHGTHVAGIISAAGKNSFGVKGTAFGYAKLLSAKAFSDFDEYAKLSDLIASIYYSVNSGAKILNCSWGGLGVPSPAVQAAFAYALSRDVVPIVSAGNSHQDVGKFSPASIEGLVSVGSINSQNQLSSFSNYGLGIDLLAFGGDLRVFSGITIPGRTDEAVLSTVPAKFGLYSGLSGTSMSAPFVTGVAALIRSARPDLTAKSVIEILKSSGDQLQLSNQLDLSAPNQTMAKYARLNAEDALDLALTYPNSEVTSSKPQTCTNPTDGCTDPDSTPPPGAKNPDRAIASADENQNRTRGGCSFSQTENSSDLASQRIQTAKDQIRSQMSLFSFTELLVAAILTAFPIVFSFIIRRRSHLKSK